jgi:exopolysaccharide biosynthesis WecB/TagA/CpsF family protein
MTPAPTFPAGARRIAVNTATEAAALAAVADCLDTGRGFALATLNLDHLVKLPRSEAFSRAYAAHTIVVADGNPVVWLARLAGRPVALVPGSDLMGGLLRVAAGARAPVALVGATAEVLEAAAARLEAQTPGLAIVARIAPSSPFDPEGAEADAVIAELGRSGARLCLLALGAPRQEIFAARALAALPQTGFASIGAGLDFVVGSQRRAPVWMRRIAMEWAWRMAGNPRRLAGRYLGCAAILPRLAADALAQRRVG